MAKSTDIAIDGVALHYLSVPMRMPLKFGPEICTDVAFARVKLTVHTRAGAGAEGWGETPLGVQWCWPSTLPYFPRLRLMERLCELIARALMEWQEVGHPIELGADFQAQVLPSLLAQVNAENDLGEPVPWLTALVCLAAFDLALHDAYGHAVGRPVYELYTAEYMNRHLAAFLQPAPDVALNFDGQYPQDYLVPHPPQQLPAWHLVGGVDPLTAADLTGSEPDDGYPVLLGDWIARDGLNCLKIKLRGVDQEWDYQRIVRVGELGVAQGADWLTTDFNCTAPDVTYVNEILDRLVWEHPRLYGMILYVEQPFPYDLEAHRLDVHSLSARKPLFMDESAHDWELVRLGRQLGWTGVALKTCKTQTGALLSLCWAKAHGMTLMVQDSTNPMLAMIPHALLAAHAGTIMGLESNAPQFYPDASLPEAQVHPGLYRRREGRIDLSTLAGPGFGYRLEEIQRELPPPVVELARA